MQIKPCTEDQMQHALVKTSDIKKDAFAFTFIGKANKQEMWKDCVGVFDDEDNLMGASIVTTSKHDPKNVNMQLLHTFHDYRFKGVAKMLMNHAVADAHEKGIPYFRVSAERSAVAFYAKCGVSFLGFQKSGTLLAFMRTEELVDRHTDVTIDDVILKKAVYANGKISLDRCEVLDRGEPSKFKGDKEIVEQLGSQYLYSKLHTALSLA